MTIDRREATEHLRQRLDRRLIPPGLDIHGRMDDRQLVVHRSLGRADDVEHQLVAVHRADRADLDRLVVDDDERRVLRRE